MSWVSARNPDGAGRVEAKMRTKWLMKQAEKTDQQTVFLLNLLNEHRLEIEARDAVMFESSKFVTKLQAENESLKLQLQELQLARNEAPGSSSTTTAGQPAQRAAPRPITGSDMHEGGSAGGDGPRPALSRHARAAQCCASNRSTHGGGGDLDAGVSPRNTVSLLQEARAKLRVTSEPSGAAGSLPEPPPEPLSLVCTRTASEPLAPPTPQPSLRLPGPAAQAQAHEATVHLGTCVGTAAHVHGNPAPGSNAGRAVQLEPAPSQATSPPPPPPPQSLPLARAQAEAQTQTHFPLESEPSPQPHTDQLPPPPPESPATSRGLHPHSSEPAQQPLQLPQPPLHPQRQQSGALQPKSVQPHPGPHTPPLPQPQCRPQTQLQLQVQSQVHSPAVSADQHERLEARCKSLSSEVELLRKQVAAAQREAAVATSNYLTCKKDLEILTRKYDSLMVQKLEVEEQRDRLFSPQLDLSLVRQAMPVVDAALNDAEERLRAVVEMLASTQEGAEEAARMHFEQRRKWVEKLDGLHQQLADREARLAQLEAQMAQGGA